MPWKSRGCPSMCHMRSWIVLNSVGTVGRKNWSMLPKKVWCFLPIQHHLGHLPDSSWMSKLTLRNMWWSDSFHLWTPRTWLQVNTCTVWNKMSHLTHTFQDASVSKWVCISLRRTTKSPKKRSLIFGDDAWEVAILETDNVVNMGWMSILYSFHSTRMLERKGPKTIHVSSFTSDTKCIASCDCFSEWQIATTHAYF